MRDCCIIIVEQTSKNGVKQMSDNVKTVKNNGKTWCSIQEAAEILGVSYQTVRRRIMSGDLEVRREGRRYFIKLSDVEKLVEQMENVSKQSKIDQIISMEVELKLANERIKALQEQIEILKEQHAEQLSTLRERIKELEADKGFLLEQLREKDRIIKELMPRALPRPRKEGWLKRLFKRSRGGGTENQKA